MNKQALAEIKDAYKALRSNIPEANKLIKKAQKEYQQKINESQWFFERDFARQSLQRSITKAIDYYSDDDSFYFIYKDGTEVCKDAEDILNGEKIKLTDIIYACYGNCACEFDTDIGTFTFFDDFEDDEALEAKEKYETSVQYKYNTAWAQRQNRKA